MIIPKRPPRVHGFRVAARSYEDVELNARRLREVLGISPVGCLPGMALFESLNQHTVDLAGREVPVSFDVRPLPVEAQTEYDEISDEFVVVLSEETYRRLRADHVRARFSLGHELGHLVFHPGLVKRLSTIPHTEASLMRGTEPKHRVFEDSEWQANAFAAALLMPARGLRELEDEHGDAAFIWIASQFVVSEETASYRWATYQKRRAMLLR